MCRRFPFDDYKILRLYDRLMKQIKQIVNKTINVSIYTALPGLPRRSQVAVVDVKTGLAHGLPPPCRRIFSGWR